jgi:hypothetical protein
MDPVAPVPLWTVREISGALGMTEDGARKWLRRRALAGVTIPVVDVYRGRNLYDSSVVLAARNDQRRRELSRRDIRLWS